MFLSSESTLQPKDQALGPWGQQKYILQGLETNVTPPILGSAFVPSVTVVSQVEASLTQMNKL